jgi:glycosyltransferase involved in cell wall biosynthesis
MNMRFLLTFQRTTRRIRDLLDSLEPDIVHVNTPYNFQTARAAFHSDGALVWHFNDTLTPWPINRIAGRLASRWADEIVVLADAVQEHFFAPEVETQTLYPPVDLDEFDPDKYRDAPPKLRDELGIGNEGLVVGTIGNVNPTKGHRYLLEAVPDVLDQFPDANFLIVGSKLDSQEHYFEELRELIVQLGIEDAVHFTGWRSDIPELLSLFDLFVLSSTTEACPIVVLEAMAMCCPVVATDVGGVSEQIPSEEYGWVVPPKDSAALAESVQESLLSESNTQKKAQNAKKHVKKKDSHLVRA